MPKTKPEPIEDQDDDFLDGVSETESGKLSPIADADVEISGLAGLGDGDNPWYAYSRILADALDSGIDTCYLFLQKYIPKKQQEKVLIQHLMRLFEKEFVAPCLYYQLRFDEAIERRDKYLEHMGSDKAESKKQADLLLSRWAHASTALSSLRVRRLRYGLPAFTNEDRAKWYTAEEKLRLIEIDASGLPELGYEYFQAGLVIFNLQRERANLEGKAVQDFTRLILALREGKATVGQVLSSGPWALREAVRYALQNAGYDNPNLLNQQKLIAGASQNRPQRAQGRMGRMFNRQGGGEQPYA